MAQGHGIIQNPIAHLDKLRAPEKKLSREQKAVHRRVAQFEALRAQEAGMAGLVMQDMNPVEHQKKATFTPGKSQALPAPPQPTFQPPPPLVRQSSTVQRVARPLETPNEEPDGFDELAAELGQGDVPDAHVTPPAAQDQAGDDVDIDAYVKRFKGTPEELIKQLAKSGSHAEKRMRQLEAERQMLLKQGVQPVQAQPAAPPVTQQLQVQPQFNYKRFKDNILDDGDKVAQEFEQHLTGTIDQKMAQAIGPLYEEAIDNRLFRKFGDVVTEDNLDLIKAMAQNAVGNNRWEKMVSAVQSYKTSMPAVTPHELPEVRAMHESAQTPSPQGRTAGDKKMFKQSYLRELMDKKILTGEYQRDPKWRRLIDTAYREGRVLRGQ